MVGGFGSSSYLLDRVKQEFGGRVKTISAPYKPEMAVVCGAVYAGLNPKMVSARVTRRCYGINVLDYFEEGVDLGAFRSEMFGNVWCTNRFSTFVRKDQKVQVDECIANSYQFINRDRNSNFSIGIYAIDGIPPRYVTDTGVSKLGVIPIPTPFRSSDPLGHRVNVEVKMYFGLNEIKAEGFVQGKKYSTTVQFDGGDSDYTNLQLLYNNSL
ncbi:Heat shock 70 kDa protein 12A [Mortierella sp. AD094]|nr:Heat shock 70 kDa protein 12A [Mortierella sp. AD094]